MSESIIGARFIENKLSWEKPELQPIIRKQTSESSNNNSFKMGV
jgi:hypothetical protein